LRRALATITHGLNRATAIVCGMMLIALTASAMLQVIYRYVLLEPLIWSDEACRHLLVWISFLTGGLVIAQRLNPRVEFFEARLSPTLRRAIAMAIDASIVAFLVFLAVVGYEVAVTYASYRTLGTGIPQSWPRLALPAGAVVMAINALDQLARRMAEDGASGGGKAA
jgi:TRAP-type C4-dicarboxylate transport system permease small subunit